MKPQIILGRLKLGISIWQADSWLPKVVLNPRIREYVTLHGKG